MRTIGQMLGIEKGETVVKLVKGDAALQSAIRRYTKLGYKLESSQPQGRKRVLLTFQKETP